MTTSYPAEQPTDELSVASQHARPDCDQPVTEHVPVTEQVEVSR
jgi:hypothetical protein